MKTPAITVGPQLQEAMTMAYRSGRSVMLIGGTGVGKSESLTQCAAALKIGVVVRDLSLMEAVELSGLPFNNNGKTAYAPPEFLPSSGKGLLVFEEINRAPDHVRAPLFQLLTSRTLNDYKLPDGWLPVAAMNPPGVYQTEDLDPALMARFIKVNVVADPKMWCVWARANGVHPSVCNYVAATRDIFTPVESNPRAWHDVSDVVGEFERGEYAKDVFEILVSGIVGPMLGHAFVTFYLAPHVDRPPDPEEVLSDYPHYAHKVRAWTKSGKTAVLDSLVQQLLIHVQGALIKQRLMNDPAALGHIQALCADLPAELRARVNRHVAPILKKVSRV